LRIASKKPAGKEALSSINKPASLTHLLIFCSGLCSRAEQKGDSHFFFQ